jgi:cephalosporin hydroxylase
MTTREAFEFVSNHFSYCHKAKDIEIVIPCGMLQQYPEIRMLYLFLKGLDPMQRQTYMEIGVAAGGTFALMSTLFPGTKIGIDKPTPIGDDVKGSGQMILFDQIEKRDLLLKKHCGENIHLLALDSHEEATLSEVEKVLSGKIVDFLFIDGDHTYKGVKEDYKMYSPLVRKGGVIAFHDIQVNPKAPACEVPKFWAELVAERGGRGMFEFNILSQEQGIGVVIK